MAHSGTVMSFQSYSPDRPSRSKPARLEGVDRDARSDADVTGTPPSLLGPRDNVELPATARELGNAPEPARPPKPRRPVDRMDLIMKRVAEGFYDRDEVVDAVVRLIAEDLAATD